MSFLSSSRCGVNETELMHFSLIFLVKNIVNIDKRFEIPCYCEAFLSLFSRNLPHIIHFVMIFAWYWIVIRKYTKWSSSGKKEIYESTNFGQVFLRLSYSQKLSIFSIYQLLPQSMWGAFLKLNKNLKKCRLITLVSKVKGYAQKKHAKKNQTSNSRCSNVIAYSPCNHNRFALQGV